jgi:hypothetical protein
MSYNARKSLAKILINFFSLDNRKKNEVLLINQIQILVLFRTKVVNSYLVITNLKKKMKMKRNLTQALKIGFAALIFGGLVLAGVPRTLGNSRLTDPPTGTGSVPMPKPPIKLMADPPTGTGTVPMPKPPLK